MSSNLGLVRKVHTIAGTSHAVVIPAQIYKILGTPEYFEFDMDKGALVLRPVTADARKNKR